MSHARQVLGQQGEALAASYLKQLGWPILARNWRTRGGEIDLVARDDRWLVVVEVRARRGARFGRPEESIDARKQRRLLGLAARYVHHVRWPGAWRIDVIAIEIPPPRATEDASPSTTAPPATLPAQPRRADAIPTSTNPSGLDDARTESTTEIVLPDGVRLRHLRHAVAP